MNRKILVVEDNKDLSDLLQLHLTDQAWVVEIAADGRDGHRKALGRDYDLIILDIMLPGMDGMEILKRMREKKIQTPVLMLTSKSSETERVLGLELGADDYVTKPFSILELIARIKAIFRRIETLTAGLSNPQDSRIRLRDLAIDPAKRSVRVQGELVALTAKEFDLLAFFAARPGRVFNRAQLLDRVWGYGHEGYEHTVNSNINRLRAKIEKNPAQPEYILTVWGVGYKFREE